jgi:hypothetical protein
MLFEFGDIVLVPFPFTSHDAFKRRPAVHRQQSHIQYRQGRCGDDGRHEPTSADLQLRRGLNKPMADGRPHQTVGDQAGLRYDGTVAHHPPARLARHRRSGGTQKINRRYTRIELGSRRSPRPHRPRIAPLSSAPIRVSRLRQIGAGPHAHQAFQRAEQRMARPGYCWRRMRRGAAMTTGRNEPNDRMPCCKRKICNGLHGDTDMLQDGTVNPQARRHLPRSGTIPTTTPTMLFEFGDCRAGAVSLHQSR